MAEIGVDLSEAQDFAPLPDGAYEVVCNKKPEMFTSTETSLPCLKWELDVVGNEGQEEFDGRKIFRNTPMSGKGAGFTLQMLQGLGVPYTATYEDPADETSKILGIRFDDDHTVGARAVASVTQRTWKDKRTNKTKTGNDFELSPLAGGDSTETA